MAKAFDESHVPRFRVEAPFDLIKECDPIGRQKQTFKGA
jgi:hypothetical protein